MTITQAVENSKAHSTQKTGGVEPLVAIKQKAKVMDDLFSEAQYRFGLDENEVRSILKAKGIYGFVPSMYNKYIEVIRWEFIQRNYAEELERIKQKENHINHLRELENRLTIDLSDPSCWKWAGTQEELDAHWELEEIRREDNRRLVRARLTPIYV